MNDILRFYPAISGFPTLLVILEFFYFIKQDRRLLRWGAVALEVMILVVPFVLLRVYEVILGMKLGEALFNPAYGWCIYTLIVLCQLAYFYCSIRKKMATPLWEVVINCLLVLGILLNILIAVELAAWPGILTICLPAILLFILMLVNNHRLLIYTLEDTPELVDVNVPEPAPARGRLFKTCMRMLQWPSLFSKIIKRKIIDTDKLH